MALGRVDRPEDFPSERIAGLIPDRAGMTLQGISPPESFGLRAKVTTTDRGSEGRDEPAGKTLTALALMTEWPGPTSWK